MGILDIYNGLQSWSSYISCQPTPPVIESLLTGPDGATGSQSNSTLITESLKIVLPAESYPRALEGGLGVVDELAYASDATDRTFEIEVHRLAAGLDALGADFNLLLGDAIWKLELREPALVESLKQVRLPEFEHEVFAYRVRAERAYLSGWYEEALADFVEAEKRNYPDYSVLRSIASILLYHLVDIPRALEYFLKAAKYARPADVRQSAAARYFAAIVCLIERKLADAAFHLREASELNPALLEAHYLRACVCALADDPTGASASLEPAIKGDPRYYERAKRDRTFDSMKVQIEGLLDRLVRPAQDMADHVKHEAEELKQKYVIVSPEGERISHLFDEIEQQASGPRAQMARPDFMETLSHAEQELSGIHDLFDKQYEIDPRDYVRSMTFSPDGKLLAAGFLHGAITVWDVQAGNDVMSLWGHLASVNSVAFSPNSQLLATASRDKTVKIWDIAGGHSLLNLVGHRDEVRAVTFSPDGQWIASGSHDKTVRMWRVETGREVQEFSGHTNKVTAVLFSPDGRLLATCSSDKSVRLWDVASGKPLVILGGHSKGVASLAFSADGRWLASGADDTTVRVWDVESGSLARTLKGHRYSVTSVAFSPDGRLLAAGSLGQTIILWRLATASMIKSLRFSDISYYSVAFSPNGEWLALGSRALQLWLKGVLTFDQYQSVKSGPGWAPMAESDDDRLWAVQNSAIRAGERPNRGRHIFENYGPMIQPDGLCEVCAKKLGRFERLFYERCKLHR